MTRRGSYLPAKDLRAPLRGPKYEAAKFLRDMANDFLGERSGDIVVTQAAHEWLLAVGVRDSLGGAPDVSLAATPATDDLRNALQILDAQAVLLPVGSTPTVHEVIEAVKELPRDVAAVARLLRAALTKLEQGAR